MHPLARLHCASCSFSFSPDRCLHHSFDRLTSCIVCEEERQLCGTVFLDSHQCPRCRGPAAYVIAAHDHLREFQIIYKWAKGRTATEFRDALSKLWRCETKTHMEFILNTLHVFGDELHMTPAVEEWFHQAGEEEHILASERTDAANRKAMGFSSEK